MLAVLQVSAVVAGDQGDLVVAIHVLQLCKESLDLVGFLTANALSQLGDRAIMHRIHTDELGRVGIFEKGTVEELVKLQVIEQLHKQDLPGHLARVPIEAGDQRGA